MAEGLACLKLSEAKLDEIDMPVRLRGDAEHVYDLEPLISYFVRHMQLRATASVPHPQKEGEELGIGDIEPVEWEARPKDHEARVRAVLEDFEMDVCNFLGHRGKVASFTNEQVDALAATLDPPGAEWTRVKAEKLEETPVHAFLEHVKGKYGANFRVGDAQALRASMEGDVPEAEQVYQQLEELLEKNMEVNVISDYDHGLKARVYIFNPDPAEVVRVQRREIAAQQLLQGKADEEDED